MHRANKVEESLLVLPWTSVGKYLCKILAQRDPRFSQALRWFTSGLFGRGAFRRGAT
jgi:hypothetical protein